MRGELTIAPFGHIFKKNERITHTVCLFFVISRAEYSVVDLQVDPSAESEGGIERGREGRDAPAGGGGDSEKERQTEGQAMTSPLQ